MSELDRRQRRYEATGGGMDEDSNVYAVNCTCQYATDRGALNNPPGSLWKVMEADRVPDGARVAPEISPSTPN
jgi:hypothetical protein